LLFKGGGVVRELVVDWASSTKQRDGRMARS
jgi:hypothetical protein